MATKTAAGLSACFALVRFANTQQLRMLTQRDEAQKKALEEETAPIPFTSLQKIGDHAQRILVDDTFLQEFVKCLFRPVDGEASGLKISHVFNRQIDGMPANEQSLEIRDTHRSATFFSELFRTTKKTYHMTHVGREENGLFFRFSGHIEGSRYPVRSAMLVTVLFPNTGDGPCSSFVSCAPNQLYISEVWRDSGVSGRTTPVLTQLCDTLAKTVVTKA